MGTDTLVYLVNVKDRHNRPSKYHALRPTSASVFLPGTFASDKKGPPLPRSAADALVFAAAVRAGQSCDDVCAAATSSAGSSSSSSSSSSSLPSSSLRQMTCDKRGFPVINSCAAMEKVFPCQRCEDSLGFEQPAFVASAVSNAGACLVTTRPLESTCEASHPDTMRLCPCTTATSDWKPPI